MDGVLVVTVAAGSRRADLALPPAVPVADLVPDLAAELDLLDADRAHEGLRLLTATGRLLAPADGLAAQGVEDGAVLALARGRGSGPPRVHDDPAEALAEVLCPDLSPVPAVTLRRTASAVGCLLSGLGVAVLVAAALGADARVCLGSGLVAAGSGWLAVRDRRLLAVPPVVAGLALVALGAVLELAGGPPPGVLPGALVLVVATGWSLPSLAASAAGLTVDRDEVALDVVSDGARLARRVLLAGLLTEGLLVVALVPSTVAVGPWGAGLAVACCLAVLLQARRHRSGAEAWAGLGAGVAGLLAVVAAGLWLHAGWRTDGGVSLLLAGAGVLLLATRSWPSPARRGRLADLAETVVRWSLLPLLVPVSGLLPLVRSLVP